MKFEVLLATIDQTNDAVLDAMNVQSDVLVCNQTPEKTAYVQYEKNGYHVRWYDFQERGVGLNRNNAMLRASAEICLIADDDVLYENDYVQTVLDAFEKNPKADVIVFNTYLDNGEKRSKHKKPIRINAFNYGRYGAYRIAFRRMSVIKNSISFNQLFGGGCMFSAGEDTIFLYSCLKKGLHIVAVPDCILRRVDRRPSTWFKGYTQKFFEDTGTMFCCQYGKLAELLVFVQLFRRRKKWLREYTLLEAWRFARTGIMRYRKMR